MMKLHEGNVGNYDEKKIDLIENCPLFFLKFDVYFLSWLCLLVVVDVTLKKEKKKLFSFFQLSKLNV